VFTRNNFPGHPVTIGRKHIQSGRLQAIIVNSGNSNVATGQEGLALAYKYVNRAADHLQIAPELILPSSTGVIGRPLPENTMLQACDLIKQKIQEADFPGFARAIMTTDAWPKMKTIALKSGIRITGVAKGAGMIEPNMATMLAYIVTDAAIEPELCQKLLSFAVNRSFNRISVDSDTSTSDTVVLMASGKSNVPVQASAEDLTREAEKAPWEEAFLPDENARDFLRGLLEICQQLACEIAKDGEGATKLVELRITQSASQKQALKIARSIINSPLIKTAIHGADPNWGRIVMAVGKVFDEPLKLENIRVYFGSLELQGAGLQDIANYLKQSEICLTVSLGCGQVAERMWGCDLTAKYVAINSEYTT
jgi:glutamate N-acetyltransferase/amino-acid N-acetyltransferase